MCSGCCHLTPRSSLQDGELNTFAAGTTGYWYLIAESLCENHPWRRDSLGSMLSCLHPKGSLPPMLIKGAYTGLFPCLSEGQLCRNLRSRTPRRIEFEVHAATASWISLALCSILLLLLPCMSLVQDQSPVNLKHTNLQLRVCFQGTQAKTAHIHNRH